MPNASLDVHTSETHPWPNNPATKQGDCTNHAGQIACVIPCLDIKVHMRPSTHASNRSSAWYQLGLTSIPIVHGVGGNNLIWFVGSSTSISVTNVMINCSYLAAIAPQVTVQSKFLSTTLASVPQIWIIWPICSACSLFFFAFWYL
jgi:hypothetical protein